MIGLPSRGDDVMRAYSIVSAPTQDFLEFFSIKAPGGVFTTDLKEIQVGEEIEVADHPVGTLLLDNLESSKRLVLLATGTGIAPFVSIVRDGAWADRYEELSLVHSTRTQHEQVYVDEMLNTDIDMTSIATRQGGHRITTMLKHGLMELNPEEDRVMLCGNEEFVKEMTAYLAENGWRSGSKRTPGTFVYERAFVS
jgi:ferredoxin--NADP+ reductase